MLKLSKNVRWVGIDVGILKQRLFMTCKIWKWDQIAGNLIKCQIFYGV